MKVGLNLMNKKTPDEKKIACAVIYTRVSTDEQASQQHKLPAQERKCVEYCTRNNLEADRVFTDAESGRTDDRPQFQAMIRYCHRTVPGSLMWWLPISPVLRVQCWIRQRPWRPSQI
jgi:hypothetical protein